MNALFAGLCALGFICCAIGGEQTENRARLMATNTIVMDGVAHPFKVWLWDLGLSAEKLKRWEIDHQNWLKEIERNRADNPEPYSLAGLQWPKAAAGCALVITQAIEKKEIIVTILYGASTDAAAKINWDGEVTWHKGREALYGIGIRSQETDLTMAITELTDTQLDFHELMKRCEAAETFQEYLGLRPEPTPCIAYIRNKGEISVTGVTLKTCIQEHESILLAFNGARDGKMVRYHLINKEWRPVTLNIGEKLTEKDFTPRNDPQPKD